MTDLEALIAEAARLARQPTTLRSSPRLTPRPQPDLSAVVADAHVIVTRKARIRERRRRAEAREAQVADMSSLWANQRRDAAEQDFCVIRVEAVRGIPEFQMAACRLTFDERRPGERTPHVHGGKVPCDIKPRCFRCGEALKGGKRRWCSLACSNLWWTNHMWSMASAAVLKRDDYRCVKCGKARGDVLTPGLCSVDGEAWPCAAAEEVALVKGVKRLDLGAFVTLPGERARYHQPVERKAVTLEVNHKTPLVGRGYDQGCVHHLDGLETLCHDCHAVETTRQGRERRNARALSLDIDHPPKGIPL